MHLRQRTLPGWCLSPQSTWPSAHRVQAWPKSHGRIISKCPGCLLLLMAGQCVHTHWLQLSCSTKLSTCRWLPASSHWSPAPAPPPSTGTLPSTSKHGAPRLCHSCPASFPASAPLHPCPHLALAGTRQAAAGARAPPEQTLLPLIPCGAGGQSCSYSRELSSPPSTPQFPRNKVYLSIYVQRFPFPNKVLSCCHSTRSDTYLLRLPQVVLGSAREETARQVLELAQPLPGCWYPRDAAPTQGQPQLAGTAPWLTGEGWQPE